MGDSTAFAPSLGERLRQRRKQRGLIMQEVAQATGLSVGFISQIERDIAQPSLASLNAIAQVLGISPSALLSAQPDPVAATCDGGVAMTALTHGFPGSRLSAELRVNAPDARRLVRRTENELMLLVLCGALTLEIDGAARVLGRGEAVHLPPGCELTHWNHTGEPTTVLHCTVARDPML